MIKFLNNTGRAMALVAATWFGAASSVWASGDTCLPFGEAQTTPTNTETLQRGAKLYFNYCASCHSLQYVRYSRLAQDLKLSEDQVLKNFAFTGAKIADFVQVNMPKGGRGNPAGATEWLGQIPPDLSLTARSRGVDWIYNYLKAFYPDPSRPVGWNNLTFPNASMPNPLWELQGLQEHVRVEPKAGVTPDPHHDPNCSAASFKASQAGSMNAQAYDTAMNDLTSFLEYTGEPAILQRESYGIWVILYLCLLTFLLYLLKLEYWRDIH